MLRLLFCMALFGATSAYAQDAATPGSKLLPPVKAACISSPFGPRVIPHEPAAGTYHYGIDMPAPEGTPIVATAPGKLIRVQTKGIGGVEVLIQHANFVGVYSHLEKVAPVLSERNPVITAGERIGEVGHTGVSFGPHLYFEMIRGGRPIDPAPFLNMPSCNGKHTVAHQEIRFDRDGKFVPTKHYGDWHTVVILER